MRRLFVYVLLILGACAPTIIASRAVVSAPTPAEAPAR